MESGWLKLKSLALCIGRLARGLTSNAGIDGLGSVTAGWQLHWRADSLF